MKTSEKPTEKDARKEGIEQKGKKSANELKTDFPLSEKDEVKQAERNAQQNKGR